MEKEKKSESSIDKSRADLEKITENEDEEYEYDEEEEEEFQKTEENDTEAGDEQEEKKSEEEEETKVIKKRRCVRRKKIHRICFGSEYTEEELEICDEEEEEEETDEVSESKALSESSSVLDPITFEWENGVYEFEELCDRGTLENAFIKYYEQPDLLDNIGRARYLHLCDALSVTPIVRFFKELGTPEVDLSYRSVDSKNVRAMCAALEINRFVKNLILKFNKLVEDDCRYLGIMLYYNETISVLDLTGCRIGPENVKFLVESLCTNEGITDLNLSKCYIQDEGMKAFSKVLLRNNSIKTLDLSYNKLGDESAEALGLSLRANDCLTNLNLRYNYLYSPDAMKHFFRGMAVNKSISHLDLAWNAISRPEVGKYIKVFLKKNKRIQFLDLSDNRLEGITVTSIKTGLNKSQSLEVLKLGKNPISADDLEPLLAAVRNCTTLKILDLEDLWVKKSFYRNLKRLQESRDIEVNIGGVYSNYEIRGPDYPKLILKRAKFEAMKPKKAKLRKNFDLFIWSLNDEPLTPDEFMVRVKKFKAKINKELFPELMKQFTIPKVNLIDVVAMREKYLSIFPDCVPPLPKQTEVEESDKTSMMKMLEEPLTVIRDITDEPKENKDVQGETQNMFDNTEKEEFEADLRLELKALEETEQPENKAEENEIPIATKEE